MGYEVTIGIPTLNGCTRLARCLTALTNHTPVDTLKAKILVCDDGSIPEELERNKELTAGHNIDMLMNGERLGVAKSWNKLTRHAIDTYGSKIVVLINDDVEVVPYWLDALVFSVKYNPHAGMVGLRAYQGVNSENYSVPPPISYVESRMERGEGMLSSQGFCFAFDCEKYEEVGGFDDEFFAFYEEVDFGVALLRKGWPSYMLSQPIILHQGGATTSEASNINARKVLIESRAKFKLKHSGVSLIRDVMYKQDYPKCMHWNTALKVLED